MDPSNAQVTDAPDVTVIICTLARAERRAGLLRAIDSIWRQEGLRARPLVVLNGDRYDPALRRELEQLGDCDSMYLAEAHVGKAHVAGVRAVRTPLFSFLDDDDLLLPNALATLSDALHQANVDYAIGNGFVTRSGRERLLFDPSPEAIARLNADPAARMLQSTWLASCGGLYRRDRIAEDVFSGELRYFEWTYYGLKLALFFRGVFLPDCVFRVNETPGSASKELAYMLAQCTFLQLPIALCREHRPDLVSPWRRRFAGAYHGAASALRRDGSYWRALSYQLIGLTQPGGLKYVPALLRLAMPGTVRARHKVGE